jgi:hypothetical protein
MNEVMNLNLFSAGKANSFAEGMYSDDIYWRLFCAGACDRPVLFLF